jgi:anaerobic glycerol-3-phosphate dehydrogenase
MPVEPLAGLGVFHDGRPASAGGVRLRHLEYLDAAAEMTSGLMTDKQLHPLNEEGVSQYTNLYAAGAVLGGYDYAGACGFGVPLLTGWLAGTWAGKHK